MSNFRKILLSPYAIVLMIALALVAVMTIASRSDGSSKTDIPVTLDGKWHQVEGLKGTYMTATVYGGSIQIDMSSRDASYIYWLGTFDTDKSTSKPFETISLGDTDAMALSIFGSNSKTKTFSYKDGIISYEFTMLGSTTTVKLAKNKTPKPMATKTFGAPRGSR